MNINQINSSKNPSQAAAEFYSQNFFIQTPAAWAEFAENQIQMGANISTEEFSRECGKLQFAQDGF